MRGRTPQPPTSPSYPEPTSSEHSTDYHDTEYDFDGFGVDEDEQTDGEPLIVVQEMFTCLRDGCDAAEYKRHLYTTESASDELLTVIEYAAEYENDVYVWENVEVVDYDEVPILTVEVGEDTFGYMYPEDTVSDGDLSGPCYGREEPSVDVDAYRYDDL